jgi:hypothetical protein
MVVAIAALHDSTTEGVERVAAAIFFARGRRVSFQTLQDSIKQLLLEIVRHYARMIVS